MNMELVEIKPRELKFIFEIKKQCSCSIRLVNKIQQHVAFKIKTTSPKKYCVRPNVGVILPKSTRDFSVTMQAQRSAPPDMICKDKFLIQCTVVPSGTSDEDLTSNMFAREGGKYIEETKLRVILETPMDSPILSPISGPMKQDPWYQAAAVEDYFSRVENPDSHPTVAENEEGPRLVNSEELEQTKEKEFVPTKVKESNFVNRSVGTGNGGFRTTKIAEIQPVKDSKVNVKEDVVLKTANITKIKPQSGLNETQDVGLKTTYLEELLPKDSELKSTKDELKPTNDELKPAQYDKMLAMTRADSKLTTHIELKPKKEMEDLKLVNEVEGLKSKLLELESKLSEAQFTISKLTEDRRTTNQERERIKAELAKLKISGGSRRVQQGFPLLFVCMVAMICIVLGYILHV